MLSLLYKSQCVLGKASWHKLNGAPVCFGAKRSEWGSFESRHNLRVYQIKLVHRFGGVTCNRGRLSPFSCVPSHLFGVYLTTKHNHAIVPQQPTHPAKWRSRGWYSLHGLRTNSRVVTFARHGRYRIRRNQVLRLWYGEDLYNFTEGDNLGDSCDVYALA